MRCPVCDKPLPPQPQGRGRRRLYCSDRCRVVAWRRQKASGCEVDLQPSGMEVDFDVPLPAMTNPDEDLAQTLGTIIYSRECLLKLAPRV